MEFKNLVQGQVTVAHGPKPKGRIVKQPLEDRMEQASQDFLSHPVTNGGDTQRAELTRLFQDELAPKRKRREGAILQLPFQSQEVLGQVGLKHLQTNLVDARRAAIASDRLEGIRQQRLGNPPSEGVCFLFGNGK